MLPFWIAVALMLLLGLAFFLPALTGKTATFGTDRAKLNLLLHRQREQELAQEAASPEALRELSLESERNLLGDLEAVTEPSPATHTGGRLALGVTLVAVPLVALLTYFAVGRPDLVEHPPTAPKMADIEQSVQRLAERLKQNPNDLEGWMILGRSLLAMNQPGPAVQAFEFAMKLAPENLDIQARYAEALAGANGGALAGRPTEIVENILNKNPNHRAALWLAGIAAAERRDGAQAAEYWQKLKAQLPPQSQEAQQLGEYIAQAQGLAAEPAQPAAAQVKKRIRVKVDLAPELKAQAAPDDALFIFARAAEGPPMPLAVVRKQAKDLPLEVELDDSLSMMQGMNLSSFERVIIGARVSKTGKPTPSPGDLQGLSAPVAAENGASYAVTVDKIVGEAGR